MSAMPTPGGRLPACLKRALLLFACACACVCPLVAQANDYVVYSPQVVQGQNEVETRAFYYQDGNPTLDGESEYDVSVAHGFTSWWKGEIYFLKGKREPGNGNKLQGYEFENTFQLAPQGEFFVTPGFLFSYEAQTQTGVPNEVEFGPLFERKDGRFTQKLNLIWEHQVGGGASGKPEFRTAYSLAWRYTAPLQPSLEVYLRPSDDAYQMGPVLDGEIYTGTGGELEYAFGAVFGMNRAAPNTTWIARLEYEFF